MKTTKREAPAGRLVATFDEMHEAGCIQAEFPGCRIMFSFLMIELDGNPCDGCPVWDEKGQDCEAHQKHHSSFIGQQIDKRLALEATTKPANNKYPGMNMKQIAAYLGVSLNQARKRKREGTL